MSNTLNKLIASLQFRCVNADKGCTAILQGKDRQMDRHQNVECKYVDKSKSKFKAATVNCNKCKRKLIPDGFDFKPREPHICLPEANDRFCSYHRSKESYLFTKDRLVFSDKKNSADQSNVINNSEGQQAESANSSAFNRIMHNNDSLVE